MHDIVLRPRLAAGLTPLVALKVRGHASRPCEAGLAGCVEDVPLNDTASANCPCSASDIASVSPDIKSLHAGKQPLDDRLRLPAVADGSSGAAARPGKRVLEVQPIRCWRGIGEPVARLTHRPRRTRAIPHPNRASAAFGLTRSASRRVPSTPRRARHGARHPREQCRLRRSSG